MGSSPSIIQEFEIERSQRKELENWGKHLTSKHEENVDYKQKEKEIRKVMGKIKELRHEMEGIGIHVGDSRLLTFRRLEKEKADLLNRLSSVASDIMRNRNSKIADLSDINRPTKLAERFSELYDNEWTDAFINLKSNISANAELHEVEKIAIATLLKILEASFIICTTKALVQRKELGKIFYGDKPSNQRKDQSFELRISECQKQIAEVTIKHLRKDCKGLLEQSFKDNEKKLNLKKEEKKRINDCLDTESGIRYAELCIELSWLMGINDPPVILEFKPLKKDISQHFRPYTRSGREEDFVVWPVVCLEQDGPVLTKGVIQYKGQDRQEKQDSSMKTDKNSAIKQAKSQDHVDHEGGVKMMTMTKPDEKHKSTDIGAVTAKKANESHVDVEDEEVPLKTITPETTSNACETNILPNVNSKDKGKTIAETEVSEKESDMGTIQSSKGAKKGSADQADINVPSDKKQIINKNKRTINDI